MLPFQLCKGLLQDIQGYLQVHLIFHVELSVGLRTLLAVHAVPASHNSDGHGRERYSQSGERSVQLQYQLPPCFPYQAKGVDCFLVYTSGRRDTAAQQYNIGFSRSVCRLVGVPSKVDNGMCAFHHQLDCSEATDIPCRVTRGKGL